MKRIMNNDDKYLPPAGSLIRTRHYARHLWSSRGAASLPIRLTEVARGDLFLVVKSFKKDELSSMLFVFGVHVPSGLVGFVTVYPSAVYPYSDDAQASSWERVE